MKKVLLTAMCVILSLSLAVGCGKSSGGSSTETSTETKKEFKLSGNVEFVVPYSAGGGSDLYARIAADVIQKNKLAEVPIMVVNKPGGAGAVGDAYTASKKGNSEVITTYVSAQITGPLMNNTPVKYSDLTPIANLAMDEYTLGVLKDSAYKTIDDFIAAAKKAPGTITIGGSGKGTEDELVTGLLQKYADVKFEYVSFNSSAEVMGALLGKHLDAGIFNPNECISQYNAGQVNVLAAYGPQRISMFPDVKTFTELGYKEVVFQQFRGIFGPPEMSPEALAYWSDVFKKVTESEQWKTEYLNKNGLTSKYMTGEEYDKFLDGEAAKYEAILKDVGAIK
jgi:putative tricarboxylic transport membrane protein